jgi:hypothetical protein
MEYDWGENHIVYLYAKFIGEAQIAGLDENDQRVYEIAKSEYGTVDHFNEKFLAYLVAASTSWAECDLEPMYDRGQIPETFGRIIFKDSGSDEIPFDNSKFGIHTKVSFQVGYLLPGMGGYEIEDEIDPGDSKYPYGFLVEVWNNHQKSMDKKACKRMLGVYAKAIRKYPELIEVIKIGSPY